ncbi:MAG TPA: hypothetical protein VEB87_05220 [Nitrososphaerales archaeon]|nr:hypothetical protein [Nitrososphaerales archaeon]
MNRGLLIFALLLVFLGIGFGLYLLSVFGLLLLIPALLSAPRPSTPPAPTQPKQETRRIVPRAAERPETAHPPALTPAPSMAMATTPVPAQTQSYAPALFPTSMFPSLSQTAIQPQPQNVPASEKPAAQDELLEAGAILLLLRLISG